MSNDMRYIVSFQKSYIKVKKNSTCIHDKAALNRLCYLQEEDARLEAKEARDTDKSAAFLQ